jgi:predicted ester cyclase
MVLHQALQALNSKENKTAYFDLHDDCLITHGISGNFSANKEGMKEYYCEVWQAFPDARFNFDHIVIEGSEAACMFSITGIQKSEFMGVPPSAKGVRIEGMAFFHFKGSIIAERREVIDLLSAAKQLTVRQQLFAIKNAIPEYGEVQANAQLKDKINGLFKKHLTWMTFP